jgi:hypothetical protein
MEKTDERGPDWMGLPVIATVARLLCRELTPRCPETHLAADMLQQPRIRREQPCRRFYAQLTAAVCRDSRERGRYACGPVNASNPLTISSSSLVMAVCRC